jgi:hypothetical protein
MAKHPDEETLSADIEKTLLTEYDKVNRRTFGQDYRIKKVMASIVRWWITLTDEQRQLIFIEGEYSDYDVVSKLIVRHVIDFLNSPDGAVALADAMTKLDEAEAKKSASRRAKAP